MADGIYFGASCFGLSLDHPEAIQYKNLIKKIMTCNQLNCHKPVMCCYTEKNVVSSGHSVVLYVIRM